MRPRHALASLVAAPLLAALIHCGGPTPPGTAGAGTPRAEVSAAPVGAASGSSAADLWIEEASAPATPGGKATTITEYYLDVTKKVVPKQGYAGPTSTKQLRVIVRYPLPKVAPDGAREPHVVNKILWGLRKEIAQCFYKGPGKEPTSELSMIGFLDVSKKGEITASGIESADEPLKGDAAFGDCVMANVKGLEFVPAGDDVKIRFKLRLQTIDATGTVDFTAPEEKK